jgi:hypothetical protein
VANDSKYNRTKERQKEYTRNLTIPQKWQIKRQNNSVFAKYWRNMASKYFLINSTEIRTESVKEIHFGNILQKEDKKARKNAFLH